MELYVVRHGQTECNEKGIVMGHADSPLTENGIAGAKEVAKVLQGKKFDKIFCSDLGRAVHTALIIKQELGIDTSILPVSSLRETNYGIYNYVKRDFVSKKCSQYLSDFSYIYPEGESLDLRYDKVRKFAQKLLEEVSSGNILLVTHAGPIRALVTYFTEISKEDYQKKKLSHKFIAQFSFENGRLKGFKQISE